MSIRGRKIRRDLLGNRARTLLVVMAIAIGLAGLSTTLRARAIFTENLDAELAAAVPSAATIRTGGAGPDIVAAVAGLDGVAAAQGQHVTFGRIEVDGELRPLRMVVRTELAGAPLDRLRPEAGTWPPPDGTIALERSSLDAAGLAVGDVVRVTVGPGPARDLEVAASAYDLAVVSGRLVDQVVFGYASTTTWDRLGLPARFDEIALAVTGEQTEERIAAVAARAADAMAEAGAPVLGVRIPPPGTHILDNVIASLLLILGSLGVLSLVLSGFLVFNTVAATLTRQRPQIGVMKAIGASRGDVLKLYLAMVGTYSVLAVIVAIPAGALGARLLTGELGTLLNIDITTFGAPWWVWAVELSAGLLVPAVAALGPILSGTSATVAEVIRGEEGAAGFGTGRIDRALGRLRGVPESFRYAARNTFRRKLRLTLTVVALSLGGAILVTVLTLRASLLETVDSIEAYWQQDVTVDLQTIYPAGPVERTVAATDGVESFETWLTVPASVVRGDGQIAGDETIVFGIPPTTRFIEPTLVEGRWLRPGDQNAVVINVDVAANEPDVEVGDVLRIRILEDDRRFEVVGIATTQLVGPGEPRPSTPIVYAPLDSVAGGVNRLVVSGAGADPAGQDRLADAVDAALTDAGFAVQAVDTRSRTRAQVERLTTPILLLLVAMAGLFAVVGGLGLLGTMSLNVLERTAEFGVVRSVGATGRTVLSIVLVEGLAVALLAWVGGSLLAVPLGWVMGIAVGISFIRVPLAFSFAPLGVLLWLAMAVVLAVIASYVPARNASRISVRDAIAYE